MAIEITKYLSTELNTLTLPDYSVMEVSIEDNVTEFRSSSRLSQFLHQDVFYERTWAVSIPNLTTAEMTSLDTFFKNQNGRAVPFKWTVNSSNENVFARFDGARLSFKQIKAGHWECAFTLREAHPLEIEIVEEPEEE